MLCLLHISTSFNTIYLSFYYHLLWFHLLPFTLPFITIYYESPKSQGNFQLTLMYYARITARVLSEYCSGFFLQKGPNQWLNFLGYSDLFSRKALVVGTGKHKDNVFSGLLQLLQTHLRKTPGQLLQALTIQLWEEVLPLSGLQYRLISVVESNRFQCFVNVWL